MEEAPREKRFFARKSRARGTDVGDPGTPAVPNATATTRPSRWPAYPPRHYLGQLSPEFQDELAADRTGLRFEDCEWYHAVELSNGRITPGAWDLRGNEGEYLGGVSVQGSRVLELGPASGCLTMHMVREGAEVVCFEAGFDVANDVVPFRGQDMRHEQMKLMAYIDRVHNSWWYHRQDQGLSPAMVYGDIYRQPGDLGTFDVSVFGCILLHLRDPWSALHEAAMRTRSRLIVTESIQDDAEPDANIMRFAPAGEHEVTNWWSIHPGAVVSMMQRLGFSRTTVTKHTQKHHLGHRMEEAPVDIPLFTVVGERT